MGKPSSLFSPLSEKMSSSPMDMTNSRRQGAGGDGNGENGDIDLQSQSQSQSRMMVEHSFM